MGRSMIGMGYREACDEVVAQLKQIFPKDNIKLTTPDWGESGYIIFLDGKGYLRGERLALSMVLDNMAFWMVDSPEEWIEENVKKVQKRWRSN